MTTYKPVKVEIRDLATFTIVMIISVLVFGVANFIVLINASYVEFTQGNIEVANFLAYSAIAVLLLSILLLFVFFAVIGTILKRLNKANQWVEKHYALGNSPSQK
jgi:hypothetical protein